MNVVGNSIVYCVIALSIIVFSVLSVTSRKILRSATYLLFTLFATAALYFQLGYEFLVEKIGHALLGTEKFEYLLPFEAISVLLLACIIGGVVIARKR